jgi:hypothetical protein
VQYWAAMLLLLENTVPEFRLPSGLQAWAVQVATT